MKGKNPIKLSLVIIGRVGNAEGSGTKSHNSNSINIELYIKVIKSLFRNTSKYKIFGHTGIPNTRREE